MKFTHIFSLQALLLGALMLGGCATVNTVEPANPTGKPNYIADKRIISDRALNGIADVLHVSTTRVGNLLKVQVTVQNHTVGVKNFNYQFEWYDAEGMMVGSPSQKWLPISIEGNERLVLTSVAPNPSAVDFRLKLLESVRMSGTIL